MFEFKLIKKYLYPRFKQLSVSIISLISIFVVTVVVWLVLVFLSVVNGMEKNWTEKLIALSAPLQILPTDEYYRSDYYQIDGISYQANYNYKTIEEKLSAPTSYDPTFDEEPPQYWLQSGGKDLVKEVMDSVSMLSKNKTYTITASDFQVSIANARFRLLRSFDGCNLGSSADSQSFLTQIAYLASFEPKNNRLQKTILPLNMQDLTNIFCLLGSSAQNIQQDQPQKDDALSGPIFRKRLDHFLKYVKITHLKTGSMGYRIPRDFLAHSGKIQALYIGQNILIIPDNLDKLSALKNAYLKQNIDATVATIWLDQDLVYLNKSSMPLKSFLLQLPQDVFFSAQLIQTSIKNAQLPSHLKFLVQTEIQKCPFAKEVFFNDLEIGQAEVVSEFNSLPDTPPFWAFKVKEKRFTNLMLPSDYEVGEGVLLPKAYRENGVLCGDRGYLSYHGQSTSSVQEMRIPIYVAGFYDPGLIPNSGKVILAPKKIISTINASIQVKDSLIGNGINVWFDQVGQVDIAKSFLQEQFKKRGIDRFWQIKTYKEYEYAKDFIEQLASDKTLFSLIAIIIIMVACTNIISMLILLVNDKKKEIGILQAMGASKKSIAFIFGGCGLAIGLFSSLIGTFAAYLTLKNIKVLMDLLNRIQGHAVFNPAFFGDSLPSSLNFEAFMFVVVATTVLSLLAGLIPAIKAMRLNPTEILKSEN